MSRSAVATKQGMRRRHQCCGNRTRHDIAIGITISEVTSATPGGFILRLILSRLPHWPEPVASVPVLHRHRILVLIDYFRCKVANNPTGIEIAIPMMVSQPMSAWSTPLRRQGLDAAVPPHVQLACPSDRQAKFEWRYFGNLGKTEMIGARIIKPTSKKTGIPRKTLPESAQR